MENNTISTNQPTIKFSIFLTVSDIEKMMPVYKNLLKSQSSQICIDLSETENIEEFAFLELVRFRLMARKKFKKLNIKTNKANQAFEILLDRFNEGKNFQFIN